MAVLRIGLVLILFRVVVSEEVFRPSNSGVFSFGNFLPHENYTLSMAEKLKEERVKSSDDCLIRCVQTNRCVSTNVNTTRDDEGLYACELLASDKYENTSKFRASKGFDHYSIAVSNFLWFI